MQEKRFLAMEDVSETYELFKQSKVLNLIVMTKISWAPGESLLLKLASLELWVTWKN